MPRPTSTSPKPLSAHKHTDKRANIPTEELRDFVEEQEKAPRKMLYPRDQSLDPQLVWRGKDEQDAAALEVPAVPIYIQEKIHPQAIIEDLRRHPPCRSRREEAQTSKAGGQSLVTSAPTEQFSLFSDFNGIQFEQLIEFYQHQDGVKWANRMILGDSLLVMTSLAEKEGLKGKVQMIYLDPPYGIKFGSNWQVSTRKRDVKDGKAEDATRQPEQIRAFRDTWKLGIHSYLAYLRDRLVVARELLTESGSVFVQIGDENVHLVRCVLDETFGSENAFAQITFAKTGGTTGRYLAGTTDYILGYAKDIEHLKYRQIYRLKEVGGDGAEGYLSVELPDGNRRRLSQAELDRPNLLPVGSKVLALDNLTSPRVREARTGFYPVSIGGREVLPNKGEWKTHKDGMKRLVSIGRVELVGDTPRYVRFFDDFPVFPLNNLWSDTGVAGFASDKRYVVETSPKLIERCMMMTTDPGDLVLDPTCGSGTTAYVAEQWGRRWITCDTSRVSLALARTRLMAGRFPYYLLADSEEGWRKEMEASGKYLECGDSSPLSPAGDLSPAKARELAPAKSADQSAHSKFTGDLKRGFVYRRVPHITLKAIANNEEIDALHAEFAPKLEQALAALNQAVGRVSSRGAGSGDPAYKEWEVPRELPPELGRSRRKEAQTSPKESQSLVTSSPTHAEQAHTEFWRLRRERQQAIDASIARRADTEQLYDQPYEDAKRIRVTGPFTVESLSPHRVLSADANQDGTVTEAEGRQHHDFVAMILDNLRKAGVQNTRKAERLKFETLETYAGQWIHAVGTFEERADDPGRRRREESQTSSPKSQSLVTSAPTEAKLRRAAICIGPEHGTVGPELVKEAAKEAVQGVGFDLLIVCGFAFDPHVSEEMKRYGKLAVVPARMNPDLAMGDELLKKTGAGNLFMVFGEPDVEIREVGGGDCLSPRSKPTSSRGQAVPAPQLIVEIRGVDIYDPTTGQIRNSSTDDIACWFIDTDYNGESFFVRHAYFTGADEPYEKLKRALRAEIDESAWSSLYSTTSRPFDKPKTGKIAVKVINHYGDEVLKVYDVHSGATRTP